MTINDETKIGKNNEHSFGPIAQKCTLGNGTVADDTVTVVEYGNGIIHKTILTLDALPVNVVGATGVGFGGALAYTFPDGAISIHGCSALLSVDVLASNLEAADGGDFGLGTAIVADADLGDATDVDLCPTTSLDPIGTAVAGVLADPTNFDGTSTAKTVNVNLLIDDADIGGTEAIGVDGTITILWSNADGS